MKFNLWRFILLVILLFIVNYEFEGIYLSINAILNNTSTYKSNSEVPLWLEALSPGALHALKLISNFIHLILNYLIGLHLVKAISHHPEALKIYRKISILALLSLLIITIISYLTSGNAPVIGSTSFLVMIRSPMTTLILVTTGLIARLPKK